MTDIPSPHSDTYAHWVRATALNAAARIVASQVDGKTHPSVSIARMEKLIPWAETYLRTGGFPPAPR